MDAPIQIFKSGVQNLLVDEVVPQDAAQDARGFITQDGKIKLIGGRALIGADSGTVGLIRGLWFGYKTDGTLQLYRKTETKLQYLDSSGVWQDTVTGLTAGTEASFANYSSLAGSFTFMVSVDGYWKINNANPGTALQMYKSTKNFHGRIFIDKGRTILWDRDDSLSGGTKDRTGLYGSKIDPQNATVYTTVAYEHLGAAGLQSYTPTLAFKSVPNTRNSFGLLVKQCPIVTITIATPAEVTLVAHGFAGGETVTFQSSGALPTGIVAGTTYYVLVAGITADTFRISLTSAGAAVNTSGVQSGVQSIDCSSFQNVAYSGLEKFTDDYNGKLTGDKGGTGTINYCTGDVVLNFFAVTTGEVYAASYQWEDSNIGGLTDFTKSATRLAGEGFQVPQDKGGDPIMNILIGQDGAYYSLKQQRAYRFSLDDTDLNPTNEIFYESMGIPSRNTGVATQKGIIFLNTSNPDKPEMTILVKNLVTATLIPEILFAGFKFSLYDFSDAYFDTYERYIVISCKKYGSTQNDTLLLCNISDNTVDVSPYEARMFAKDNLANFYVGSSLQENVYQIYNGFDDLGDPINAYWISAAQQYVHLESRRGRWSAIREELKKFRKFNIKGMIALDQVVQVYMSFDDAPFQLVGTVLGRGTYVDSGAGQMIGSNFIGNALIGGDLIAEVFPYFCQITMKKIPKFRKRTIKLVPTGIGYFDVNFMSDVDILLFENRLPARFRSKQNVSLDGTSNDV